ncbi:hypothetical protein ACFWPA_11300 [Rhodococcus sp. NPDC058505]|uniref:hypothetical protein n=1 Tax=unclassified Rhodococcus (in: high G+C Gram-positive bacteria) TaxID=192944 RepID=UPI003658CD26
MKRGEWATDVEFLTSHSRNGVIRTSHLRALGVSPGTITGRCRPGGRWQRLLPGIILLHNSSPTRLQRNTAALMYGGRDSMLTAHAALAAHGYQRSASMSDVLLLIPADHYRQSNAFVRVERTWRMPEPVIRGTLRCAPITRAVLDAARRTRVTNDCRALLADAIQTGGTTVDELAIELAEGSCRGTALPRSVLRELGADAHSVAEIDAQQLYARSGLPTMKHNRAVETASGEFIASPDGWIDDVAMVWEIDSIKHHYTTFDHERTLERRARMQSHGIIVLTHLPRAISEKPALVLQQLRENYDLARSRPRPNVRLRPKKAPTA